MISVHQVDVSWKKARYSQLDVRVKMQTDENIPWKRCLNLAGGHGDTLTKELDIYFCMANCIPQICGKGTIQEGANLVIGKAMEEKGEK